jgi:4'-phosphopantetheinyl transferase
MWTVKEAYTKALGEGLGYEFARIEYDVLNKSITVDGEAPRGWKVSSFVVQHRSDTYVVSTARRLGEDQTIMLHLEDTPDALVNFIELKALAKCLVPQCSE